MTDGQTHMAQVYTRQQLLADLKSAADVLYDRYAYCRRVYGFNHPETREADRAQESAFNDNAEVRWNVQ
jgi:hypothetical protein